MLVPIRSVAEKSNRKAMMQDATISVTVGQVTFVQVWRMSSEDHQQRWLETMHKRIGLLTKQPGFVSMTLHASLDGRQTAVYAQWTDEAALTAAVSLPEAKRSHDEMARWGTSEGSIYKVDSVYLPSSLSHY